MDKPETGNSHQLMTESALLEAIATLVKSIIADYPCELADLVFVGVIRRGLPIAQIAAQFFQQETGLTIPVIPLQITLYRDDLTYVSPQSQPISQSLNLQESLDGKYIIIWDDVAYTLTTNQTAHQIVSEAIRAAKIEFAVLVDRFQWHDTAKEAFAPRYVGLALATSANQIVKAHLKEIDGDTGIFLTEKTTEGETKYKVMNNRISEAQYVITNQCGLNESSNYCSLGQHIQPEASIVEKISAISLLSKIGIKKIKILGGEPFDLPEIQSVIGALNASSLDYVITTNGMNEEKIISLASNPGFKNGSGLFFSLDFLDDTASSIGGCSYAKTLKAQKLIPILAGIVPLLGVNTVIHPGNLAELPKILNWINGLGGYLNICPIIWGAWAQFIYRAADKQFALLPQHFAQVSDTMQILLAMKKQGSRLACSEEYLTQMADTCCSENRFGWDCRKLIRCPLLRINADLSLMICSDLKGPQVSLFQLQQLIEDDAYCRFQQAWLNDSDRIFCANNYGCYWSNIFRANYNFSQNGSFTK